MELNSGARLIFVDEFFEPMTRSERDTLKGRMGMIKRKFRVMGYPDYIDRIEIEFLAPTKRHKPQLRSYDLQRIYKLLSSGQIKIC